MPIKSLATTLDLLGGSGIALTNEQKAVMDSSLPIKKAEAGLKDIHFWGKMVTLNGKDYLLAKGTPEAPYMFKGAVVTNETFYYSQNGVTWTDLAPLDQVTYGRASTINGMLSGNLGKKYTVEEPAPEPEAKEGEEPKAEGEEEAAPAEGEGEEGEAAGPAPLKFIITEAQRLRFLMENICTGTNVTPEGYYSLTSTNAIQPNQLFAGLSYPDKLESYTHGPMGVPLTKDVNGSWAMQFDSFKGTAVLRSLSYPGYSFVYSVDMKEFDSLYYGTGEANKDMMFMIA
jgi:radial spoke head protein 9